ncbi:hypothetical protein OG400_19010 [Micromonospora ureilytica]|uniref:hypothetical protein n=1 Tax=Micromonospora ureilytica TaxID=709868 RepID=UPI002E0DB6F7|nr:hypothetical protein OG400_19010 [Micromonospora ureilytica]
MARGARLAGHPDVADELVLGSTITQTFVAYRDLYDELGEQGNDRLALDDQEAQILIDLLIEVIDAQLSEQADPQILAVLEQARSRAKPRGQEQGAGNILRHAVNGASTLMSIPPLRRSGQWLSGRLLLADLAQVARYLARGEPDAAGATLDHRIRSRVFDALDDRPTVVIAHSLGTVVALEALHQRLRSVPLWVTLGSPIGLRTVVWPKLRPQPPSTPEGVDAWLNFWDRDDIVVARAHLETDVLPNSTGVRPSSRRVDSDGLWVHTATKYLAQAAVAGPVAAALDQMPRGHAT